MNLMAPPDKGNPPTLRRGVELSVPTAVLVSMLAYLVTGIAWALSSPVGSSPDDDYHLTSIWCPPPAETSGCEIVATEPFTVAVPAKVAESSATYAFKPDQNGSLAQALSDTEMVPSTRVDRGGYPGPYYRLMHQLVGADVDAAVLVMRIANVALPLALLGVVALAGRADDRRLIAYMAALTSVPLGLFLWASVNPSSWAFSGMLVAWAGLHAAVAAPRGARFWASGAVAVGGAVMAAVARGDSGPYLFLAAVGAVWLYWPLLQFRRWRLLLPAAVMLLGVWSFLSSGQTDSIATRAQQPEGSAGMNFQNLMQLPRLPLGIYGLDPRLGLGWTDTPMPALVYVGGMAALFVVVSVGLASLGWRKGLGLSGISFLFFALPMYMLVKDAVEIGTFVQSRYFLPLAVLVIGTVVLHKTPGQIVQLVQGQRAFVIGALGVAQSVALLTNLSRYVTGLDGAGLFGSAVDRWWWPWLPLGPLSVWLVGSGAFLLALVVSLRRFDPPASVKEFD